MGRKSVLDTLTTDQLIKLNEFKSSIIDQFGTLNQQFNLLNTYKNKTRVIALNHEVNINAIYQLYTTYHYTDELEAGQTNTLAGCINVDDHKVIETVNLINQTKKQIKSLVSNIYQLIEKNALPVPLRNEIQDEVYKRYVQAKTVEPRINWKMVYRQIPVVYDPKNQITEVLIVKHDMVTSRRVKKDDLQTILTSRLKFQSAVDTRNFTTDDLKVLDCISDRKKLVMRYEFSTYRAYIYQGKEYKLIPMTMPLISAQNQEYPVTIKEESDKRNKVRTDKILYQAPLLQSLPVYVQ
ncbi:hypothetical protein L3V86_08850 [Thiotrichales bacterium 19S11-10]|nr:hypothetical protein [Thiotrichales bacterium 19S11-10]